MVKYNQYDKKKNILFHLFKGEVEGGGGVSLMQVEMLKRTKMTQVKQNSAWYCKK